MGESNVSKLINRPASVVTEMLDGFTLAYPNLVRLENRQVVVRADRLMTPDAPEHRLVAVISGGGSGHEPAHAGYVGAGMLTGAVAGEVFTSPGPNEVLAAIRAVTGPAGALLVVKNYTGDKLNFGLAAELARAEGMAVESVVVADDVAVDADSEYAGPRGLSGTVFVHKLAGAAAAAGASLDRVKAVAEAAAARTSTMGVALGPVVLPGADHPSFQIAPGHMELGLGIHGEAGVRQVPLEPADTLSDHLIETIVSARPATPGERVALLVNNLGATPLMELAIVARRAVITLAERGLSVERVYMGSFLTSLEMPGVSLSVLRDLNDRDLALLDAPTDAPAWPRVVGQPQQAQEPVPELWAGPPSPETDATDLASVQPDAGRLTVAGIVAGAGALRDANALLTGLDRQIGDGDLGVNLSRLADAVDCATPGFDQERPAVTIRRLANLIQAHLGGTSGALYAILFHRVASVLAAGDPGRPLSWSAAFDAGIRAVAELGGAQPGDATMLDALWPARDAFDQALHAGRPASAALEEAARAAQAGAEATAAWIPRQGRASYLGRRAIGVADPGATAVAVWLSAVAAVVSKATG